MKIDVNTKPAIKGLEVILNKTKNTAPLMQDIAALLADITEDAFQGEYDPTTGVGWVGLLPGTIKARKNKGHWPGKILQDVGNLASSVVTDFSKDFAQIGTNKEYAASHQFGVTSYPDRSGELEDRPFIGFSRVDVNDLEQMVAMYIRG